MGVRIGPAGRTLLVGIGLLALAGASSALIGKASAPPLGSPQLCAGYSGLPAGWGSDAHAGMVRVSGGSFVFGSERGYPDERPAHAGSTRVKGFWIDRTEVTQAQFAAFVAATGYVTEAEKQGGAVVFHAPTEEELGRRPYAWWSLVKGAQWRDSKAAAGLSANLPVTLVTQADALAYARWLGRDLPTEAEWEYAGKAGREDALLDVAPADADGKPAANYWQGPFPRQDLGADGHVGLAPVGCYAGNAFGLHDMIGNVWEWTADAYTGPRQPHGNGDTAAVALSAGSRRAPNQPTVIKGGSFLCAPDYCVRYRASAREAQERDLAAAHVGFRTVRRE